MIENEPSDSRVTVIWGSLLAHVLIERKSPSASVSLARRSSAETTNGVFANISTTSGLATGELIGSSLDPYPNRAGGGIPHPPVRSHLATTIDGAARR